MRSRNSYERQLLRNCLIRLVYSQMRRLTETVGGASGELESQLPRLHALSFLRYLTAGKRILRLSRRREKRRPWQMAVLPLEQGGKSTGRHRTRRALWVQCTAQGFGEAGTHGKQGWLENALHVCRQTSQNLWPWTGAQSPTLQNGHWNSISFMGRNEG